MGRDCLRVNGTLREDLTVGTSWQGQLRFPWFVEGRNARGPTVRKKEFIGNIDVETSG